MCARPRYVSINQSINQLNFYSTNIPGEARLSDTTAELVFNSKIEETVLQHQQAIRHAGVYGGQASQRDVSSDISSINQSIN